MTSIKVFSKKAVSVILSLLMILTVVPAMSLTAYAADVWVMGGSQTISSDQTCTTFTVYDSATLTVNQGVAPPYADLKNTTTVVTFDGKEWYLIDYDSSTVTLLAKECVAASQYNSSGSYVEYASSTVKTAVDNWYNNNITSNAKTAVFDNKMFLLTKDQANAMTTDTRKCSQASEANYNYWWLCSPGSFGNFASCVYGGNGNVLAYGYSVVYALGVRPALKLDLSKVEFDSATNTFAVASSHEHDFTYSVNGDTITATCTATGCDLTDDNEVTLTIVAPTLTIVGQTGDGISEYATLTGLEAFNEATGLNVAETDIKYYAVETYEIDGNTYKRQGNELDGAPTDAGEYIAGLTLSDVKISETATRDVTARTWYTITEPAPTYTVTWMNGDDILETDTDLEPGALPSYDGETPTKDEDDDFTYDFIGWTSGPNFYTPDELPIVDGDTTYVATFESTPKHEAGYYVIGTMTEWKIDDNYLLTANTEAEGDEYMLNGVALTSNDAIKVVKYEPGNWTWYPDGTGNDYEITADGTYDIYFRPNCDGGEEWYENCIKAVNVTEFTITWKNDDGSVIDTTTVVYGDTPTHADATKAPDKYYTYTFVGWTPEITAVTGDAEYTATFDSTVNEYTITWKNDDGTVIDTTTVAYGEVPTHADAAKDATDQYTYTFAGWTPEITAVTGDAEYTATFDSTVNVATLINNLPAATDVSTANEEAIEAARAAYDALDDAQKALVDADTLKKLTDAEDALAAVEVSATINNLPAADAVTADNKDAIKDTIEEARAAYDALTEAQKKLVDKNTLKKLTDDEEKLAELQAMSEVSAKTGKDATYNGKELPLVNAPTSELPQGCTMKYALGKDADTPPADDQFTADVPTAKDAGTYYVWYKAVGDEGHPSTEPECKIVRLAKAVLTVIAKNQTVQYGNPVVQGRYTVKGLAKGDKVVVQLYAKLATNEVKSTVTANKNYTVKKVSGILTIKGSPNAKALPSGKTITVSYAKVKNADGYDIYAGYCGSNSYPLAKTMTGNSVTATKLTKIGGKAIDTKKNVFLYVVAYKNVGGKKVTLVRSASIRIAGLSTKHTNAKSVGGVKPAVTLKKGATLILKPSVTPVDPKKPVYANPAKFMFASHNNSVAKVDAKGRITAVGKGTANIYTYAPNGVKTKITVTVK